MQQQGTDFSVEQEKGLLASLDFPTAAAVYASHSNSQAAMASCFTFRGTAQSCSMQCWGDQGGRDCFWGKRYNICTEVGTSVQQGMETGAVRVTSRGRQLRQEEHALSYLLPHPFLYWEILFKLPFCYSWRFIRVPISINILVSHSKGS